MEGQNSHYLTTAWKQQTTDADGTYSKANGELKLNSHGPSESTSVAMVGRERILIWLTKQC